MKYAILLLLLCSTAQGQNYSMVFEPVPHAFGMGTGHTAFSMTNGRFANGILVFTTSWCGPCKTLEQNGGAFSQLRKTGWSISPAGDHIQVVDAEREPELARLYNVSSYPTFVRIRDGKSVGRLSGVLTHQQIADLWNAKAPAKIPTSLKYRHEWTHPANIKQHLLQDHGYKGPLPGSYRDMEKLHNVLHERGN